MTLFRTIFVAISLALSASGACEDFSQAVVQDPEPDEMEEIIVYGEMNLVQLRREMYRVEERFLDVFNSHNTVPDFKFSCTYRRTLSNRRTDHTCTPRYFDKLEAAGWRSRILGGIDMGLTIGRHEYGRQIQRKDQQLVAELLKLLSEKAEFREAYNEMNRVRNAYEQRVNERRKGNALILKP